MFFGKNDDLAFLVFFLHIESYWHIIRWQQWYWYNRVGWTYPGKPVLGWLSKWQQLQLWIPLPWSQYWQFFQKVALNCNGVMLISNLLSYIYNMTIKYSLIKCMANLSHYFQLLYPILTAMLWNLKWLGFCSVWLCGFSFDLMGEINI